MESATTRGRPSDRPPVVRGKLIRASALASDDCDLEVLKVSTSAGIRSRASSNAREENKARSLSPARTAGNTSALKSALTAVVDASPAALLMVRRRESWKGDKGSNVRNCPLCGIRFGLLLRRHHCRMCGQLGCHNCTGNFIGKTRLCHDCHLGLYLTKTESSDSSVGDSHDSNLTNSFTPSTSVDEVDESLPENHSCTDIDWENVKDSAALISSCECLMLASENALRSNLKKVLRNDLKAAVCDLKQLEIIVEKLQSESKWPTATLRPSLECGKFSRIERTARRNAVCRRSCPYGDALSEDAWLDMALQSR